MIIDHNSENTLRQAMERHQLISASTALMTASATPETDQDDAFIRILWLAAQLLDAPSAAFAVINLERQYFRARLNIPGRENKRLVAFCASGMLNDEPLIVEDLMYDERYRTDPLITSEPGLRFMISAPVRGPEMLSLGALAVLDYRPRRLTGSQIVGIKHLASLLERELTLRSLMRIDPLTGLQTRYYYEFEIDREWRRSRRTRNPITALLLDVDKMTDFNEIFGVAAGDRALATIGRLLISRFRRASDVLVRIGGDRMLVLLPETEGEDGLRLAQGILHDVNTLDGKENIPPMLSISIGCATAKTDRDFAKGYESLIDSADHALSQAKLAGGNCIIRHQQAAATPRN